MKSFYFSVLIILCVSCKSTQKISTNSQKSDELEELIHMMQGHFTSTEQAEADSTYYDITLHMARIWPDRGYYLYVEQAVTEPYSPYRQRIYQLEKEADFYASRVFTIKEEKSFVGQWKNPAFFHKYGRELIEEKEGCIVFLKRTENGDYEGSTNADNCKSTLRGAAYATSEVKICSDKIESWDQGFNENGKQVWGAVKGGYVFTRVH